MRRAVLAAATLLMWATCAFPQDYPNRPIRIIVPTPAGGPVDVMARVLANALPPVLGQNVFVENKPGAGNTIGSRQAAVADPDGYTLMVSAASGLVMSPMIVKNAGYDASSFAPVVLVAETPQVLVINPQLSLKSVAELVAYAKDNPGKLNYSTRRDRHIAAPECRAVQVGQQHKYPACPIQRWWPFPDGRRSRGSPDDLRYG
jgi:tripartite-type tricarboxylate transporter receptor subunit TctC